MPKNWAFNKTMNIEKIRQEFPILHQNINGKPLIYFDNAATSQKPRVVIEALDHYYQTNNANIHRGVHTLAERATADFEATRQTIKAFLNAESLENVIFTRGTTEGINLVAASYARTFLKANDEILVSNLEHHSNIVPWQLACEMTGAKLRVVPIHDSGELDIEAFEKLLTEKTKFVAITHVSNALGTINPVKEIIQKAHQVGAVVLLDGAQAAPHTAIDVQDLDCDFYVFSGHKVYAPTGIGVLYGKKALLEKMPPYMGGGEMIKEVSFEKTTYNTLPHKFEAGTPNIADTIALRHALEFMNRIGQKNISDHEQKLLRHATEALAVIPKLRIVGTAKEKASVVSFVIEGVHHLDVGMMLDANGIAVRTGHHCCQPLMKRLGIAGTIRASFSVYNTIEEIDVFVVELEKVLQIV